LLHRAGKRAVEAADLVDDEAARGAARSFGRNPEVGNNLLGHGALPRQRGGGLTFQILASDQAPLYFHTIGEEGVMRSSFRRHDSVDSGPRLPAVNGTARRAVDLEIARAIAPFLSELGGMSARAAAAELNARHVETPSGAPWSAETVIRIRERLADGRASLPSSRSR
jgi:hypothetical protein